MKLKVLWQARVPYQSLNVNPLPQHQEAGFMSDIKQNHVIFPSSMLEKAGLSKTFMSHTVIGMQQY